VGDKGIPIGGIRRNLIRSRLPVERPGLQGAALRQQPLHRPKPVAQYINFGGQRHDHAEGPVEGGILEKILFGTDTPPNEPGMWLNTLEVLCHEPPQGLNLDEDTLEDYFGNNVARMLGMETPPPPRTKEEAKARLTDTYATA